MQGERDVPAGGHHPVPGEVVALAALGAQSFAGQRVLAGPPGEPLYEERQVLEQIQAAQMPAAQHIELRDGIECPHHVPGPPEFHPLDVGVLGDQV